MLLLVAVQQCVRLPLYKSFGLPLQCVEMSRSKIDDRRSIILQFATVLAFYDPIYNEAALGNSESNVFYVPCVVCLKTQFV